jgi:hypothetical protein
MNNRRTPHEEYENKSDLVRRIFLGEMDPRDRHLGLRWQPAGEVENRAAGANRTRFGLHEQLGHTARRQPFRVGSRDRNHVDGFALDGDLPGPRQRRPSPLAGIGKRPSVLCHLLDGEGAQDGLRQDLLDEEVVSQDHGVFQRCLIRLDQLQFIVAFLATYLLLTAQLEIALGPIV